MGEAKRRGTFEERKAQAIERQKKENERMIKNHVRNGGRVNMSLPIFLAMYSLSGVSKK